MLSLRIINYKDVELKQMEGRDLRMVITEDTLGAKELSGNIVWMKPGAEGPCHSHLNEEEISYVIEGEGEVWVDGKKAYLKTGDFILYPKGSKHMFRNTGKVVAQLLCIFAPPTDPSKYKMYPETKFS